MLISVFMLYLISTSFAFSIYGDIAMSLCGAQLDENNHVADDIFNEHLVTYSDFCDKSIEILQNPNLIVRITGK